MALPRSVLNRRRHGHRHTPSLDLGLAAPSVPPRLSPARAPPQAALELHTDPVAPVDPLPTDDFDQTPAFDPTDPEHVPELDLDQTRGA